MRGEKVWSRLASEISAVGKSLRTVAQLRHLHPAAKFDQPVRRHDPLLAPLYFAIVKNLFLTSSARDTQIVWLRVHRMEVSAEIQNTQTHLADPISPQCLSIQLEWSVQFSTQAVRISWRTQRRTTASRLPLSTFVSDAFYSNHVFGLTITSIEANFTLPSAMSTTLGLLAADLRQHENDHPPASQLGENPRTNFRTDQVKFLPYRGICTLY